MNSGKLSLTAEKAELIDSSQMPELIFLLAPRLAQSSVK
jgi:hypothetical protein